MTEPKAATETLLRKTVTVVLHNEEGEPYEVHISTFSFAKTLRVFTLMGQLAAAAGADEAAKAAVKDGEAEALAEESGESPMASNFIAKVIELLPKALVAGVPAVYKLIGLAVMPNKELKGLERDGSEDVDAVLLQRGRDIAYDNDAEAVVSLIVQAVQVMGVETIIKYASPLLRTLLK